MSDFNVKVSVRNARLLRAIRVRASSVAEFCRAYSLPYSEVVALVGLRVEPIKEDGTLKTVPERLLSALGMEAEEIWPRHMERIKLAKSSAEMELSAPQVCALMNRDDAEKRLMQRELLARWTKDLNLSDAEVLGRRIAGETLEEVAKDFGVTRERIRQKEMRALRNLRKRAKIEGYDNAAGLL